MTMSLIYEFPENKILCFQETAARDGLMKMKTVYEANPALGDPMSIQVMIAVTSCGNAFKQNSSSGPTDRERTQAGQAQGGLQTVPGLARGG